MNRYVFVAIVGILCFSHLAHSQTKPTITYKQITCFSKEHNVKGFLLKNYKEIVTDEALTNTSRVELYRSEKGTWTLLEVFTNGIKCAIMSGKEWNHLRK